MKNLIIILMIFLSACSSQYDRETISWISQAQKPIIVKRDPDKPRNLRASDFTHTYTLISADAKVYVTGDVTLNLPDTINLIRL